MQEEGVITFIKLNALVGARYALFNMRKRVYFIFRLKPRAGNTDLLGDTEIQISVNAPNEKVARQKLSKMFGEVILSRFEKDFAEQFWY